MKKLVLLIVLVILSACGGSDDSGDILADTQLKDLDATQTITVCEDLVAMAPASCWQAPENLHWKLPYKDSTEPSMEVQYCVSLLPDYEQQLSVGNIKSCYENTDEDCNMDIEECPLSSPDNFNLH